MRPRFPLFAKILLWFFANLVLIGVAGYAFVEFEFHLGPESLLGGRAGRRIDALADLVNGQLRTELPSQWDDVLARTGNLYGIHLLLVEPEGRRIAGANIDLPPEVSAGLFRPHPPRPPGAPGPPEQRQPPQPPGQADDFGLFGANPPPPLAGASPPPPHPHDHRIIRAGNPARYWLLLPADVPAPNPAPIPAGPGPIPGPGNGPPITLVAVSDSIGLGGLVIDFTPWIAAAAGIVVFSLLFWMPLVTGITRSIREMTGATARVAEGRFDIRVREGRTDELGLLARSINQMASRLAGFVNGQKRFLGDIAHELCSPLARAEVALGILERKVSGGELEDLQEEVRQMSGLVNELLSFSKASLAEGRIKLQPVPLREIVERAAAREDLSADQLLVRVPEEIRVRADPDLLCRAIANLLRNAVKYAGDAGPVEADAKTEDSAATLTITDHGPGVPEEALNQLFDPFFRVDVSRARETGGTGLGLAIVKTCVESCGGRVACRNRHPHGLCVTVTLLACD